MRTYSLRKSRRVLRSSYKIYQKKRGSLAETEHKQFETDLRTLDQAILNKNKEEAGVLAKRMKEFTHERFPKTLFDHARELVYALGFAIVVAFLIRQFWFE